MTKTKNKNSEFIKNTIILFIGKFTTQFMALLLLPLFTRYLLTEDYGLVDLIQTYITLFVPILTLRIDSAIFRFLIDKRDDEKGKRKELSNFFIILICMLLLTSVILMILLVFVNIKYFPFAVINIIILMISNVFLQILRGLGKNKEYSIASIITAVSIFLFNILFILKYRYDASSILISSSIANIFCIVYVVKVTNLFKYIDLKEYDKKEIKAILKYSIPMIPNALSWWVVSVSDRTIISVFLGVAYNGIYSISCKFANVLNSAFLIFAMSWQESASLHINDEDREQFFSLIINRLLFLFGSLSLLIVVLLPFVFNILIGNAYIDSYKYIPILLYANTWNVLIGLIGGIYVAKKKTKQIANTTIVSAIINLIIHFLLIMRCGLYAACISTLISYMAMGFYRYFDCKKYVNIKIDFVKIFMFTTIFIFSTVLYNMNNLYLNIANLICVLVYVLILNKEIMLATPSYIKKGIQKIRK